MPIKSEHLASLSDADVIDQNGDKVGGVGQIYLDDATGQPAWVSVKSGLFGLRESFVPLATADVVDGNISVPFTKDFIKDAPRVDADNHLDDSQQSTLYSYYGVQRPGADAGEPDARAGFSSEQTADEEAAGRTQGLPTSSEGEESAASDESSAATWGAPAAATEADETSDVVEPEAPAPVEAETTEFVEEEVAAPAEVETTRLDEPQAPAPAEAETTEFVEEDVAAPTDVETTEVVEEEATTETAEFGTVEPVGAEDFAGRDDAVTGAPDQTGTGYPLESEADAEVTDEVPPETEGGAWDSAATTGGAAVGGAVVGGAVAGAAASEADTTAYEVPGAETGSPTTDGAPGEEFAADREEPFDAATAPEAEQDPDTFVAGTDSGDASGEPDLSGNDPENFGPTGYRPDRDGSDMSDEERERLNQARGAL